MQESSRGQPICGASESANGVSCIESSTGNGLSTSLPFVIAARHTASSGFCGHGTTSSLSTGKDLAQAADFLSVIANISEARTQKHAREVMPKLLASERCVDWSWSGGEEYREWLITLPLFPASFLSDHFDARNVLAHVRCDLREGARALSPSLPRPAKRGEGRGEGRRHQDSPTLKTQSPYVTCLPAQCQC